MPKKGKLQQLVDAQYMVTLGREITGGYFAFNEEGFTGYGNTLNQAIEHLHVALMEQPEKV